jgi:oligoribonuclease (3'-5' exoribonuclease)
MDASPKNEQIICELISKVFTTRNLLHFAHWNTNSFASHMALGDLYDQIVEDIDEIVETFQGKYGLIDELTTAQASLPNDITSHVKDEAKWVESNRSKIAGNDTAIENLVDTLLGHYHKTVYKLENLH